MIFLIGNAQSPIAIKRMNHSVSRVVRVRAVDVKRSPVAAIQFTLIEKQPVIVEIKQHVKIE